MTTGARSTEQWREHRALLEAIQRGAPVAETPPPAPPPEAEPEPVPMPRAERIGAIVLAVLALLWIAAIVTGQQVEAAPVAAIAVQVSLASGPLALLGIVYLLLQRTSRREARRFGETAAAMRQEAAALESTLGRLGTRIDDNRKAVAEHAQELLALGEDATLRLAEIGATMQRETQALTRQSEQLEGSATGLFTDMGVLITDLPRIEGQVETLATRLRDTGRDAHERVAELSTELGTLSERARDADEVAGGAAQRLAAHLARIESISNTAGGRIDSAADGIARTVDTALTSAADAVEATRASIDAQSAALLAMVEKSRSVFDDAGTEATESLEGRIAAARAQADALGERLAKHDETGRALVATLIERGAAFDRAFADVDEKGAARAERLTEMLRSLGDEARTVNGTISRGGESVDALIDRGERLRALIEEASHQLSERLPALFASIEQEATRGGSIIAAMLPQAEEAAGGVNKAMRSIGRMDTVVASQRGAIEALASTAAEQFDQLEKRARDLDALLAETTTQAGTLTEGAAPKLVAALLRVRETATQAADYAGRAFATVIEDAAARLGEESARAMSERVGGQVETRLAEIAALADRAAAAAEDAGRRIDAQINTLATSTDRIERRIADAGGHPAATNDEAVSSRVARLIDQLNSISIDVPKLLSSDVPDTMWAAYLKGDRGVFTRRASRLVDAAEAKETARRYEDDTLFREQVNRYIGEFEAMLRQILSTRDGSLLGVTLLSADMGKLYVALAQAIERLRP
ncbi:hypothetical protein [Sphingomonas solaris]|uniref:ATPase n=1 Tax=Alterirhizorhabdus solaris TaxID=2529389 RepID=A0A558R146_9SPHN|nr:hypothetical protein [Sphingomonas solaris]TVV73104.1 hypothetical protein FOY91_12965 [Sphingomonas solaris]